MDMISSAVGMKQAQTMGKIQYAVARKLLDNQQLQGAAAIKLIQAASANVNKAGDALVAQALGLGGKYDSYG